MTFEFDRTLSSINRDLYKDALDIILKAKENNNRVHVTGIGKPSHIAQYFASLISSTGTPAYYLHGTEAAHGSSGQLVPGDVVIAISNSGNTSELINTLYAVKNNGCKIIGVSGNASSKLAKMSDAHLLAHIDNEGGPLNRAPRTSIIAELLVLMGLSVLLQEDAKVSPKQYVKWHPGGTLGQLREGEKK
ncbi:MAG: SIS domain-containing protein [Bacilli bacterium]|nr:SIS domain-containing protein [Bacilli bacterium]